MTSAQGCKPCLGQKSIQAEIDVFFSERCEPHFTVQWHATFKKLPFVEF